jgi:hypothetical protein
MHRNDMLACYEELARLAAEALASAEARDWEAFARQEELEAAALASLKRHQVLPPYPVEVMSTLEALIRLILDRQGKIEALLLPWRDELGMQLQSASSSRMLARTYGAQDGG